MVESTRPDFKRKLMESQFPKETKEESLENNSDSDSASNIEDGRKAGGNIKGGVSALSESIEIEGNMLLKMEEEKTIKDHSKEPYQTNQSCAYNIPSDASVSSPSLEIKRPFEQTKPKETSPPLKGVNSSPKNTPAFGARAPLETSEAGSGESQASERVNSLEAINEKKLAKKRRVTRDLGRELDKQDEHGSKKHPLFKSQNHSKNAKKLRAWVHRASGFDPEKFFHGKNGLNASETATIDISTKVSICFREFDLEETKASFPMITEFKRHRMIVGDDGSLDESEIIKEFKLYTRKGKHIKTIAYCLLLTWQFLLIFDIFYTVSHFEERYKMTSGFFGIIHDIGAQIILIKVIMTSDKHPVFPTELEILLMKSLIHFFLLVGGFFMLILLIYATTSNNFGSLAFVPMAKGIVFWVANSLSMLKWNKLLADKRASFMDLVARKPDIWLA